MMEFRLEYKEIVQLLIENFQYDFPLVSRPYLEMGNFVSLKEDEVMSTLRQMKADDILSRVGPVYKTHSVGHSILAACEVSEDRFKSVAELINSFVEVNHNYERENKYNMWFVLTAPTAERIVEVCEQIETEGGVVVLRFPMVKPYKIDLSVKEKIQWAEL